MAGRNDVSEAGELRIDGNVLRYVSSGDGFAVPLADIAVVGEYTTPDGPAACDYFVVLLTNHGAHYEVPFYADGRDTVLEALRSSWQAAVELQLAASTSLDSRIVWPAKYAGLPLFEFRKRQSNDLWGRVREQLGLAAVDSTLSPFALEALLDVAHRELDDDPGRALATTGFVLEQIGPAASNALAFRKVHGRAWKEHGTALYMAGRLGEALEASEQAQAIFGDNADLESDHATALLLTALVQNALRHSEEALVLLDRCMTVFERHTDTERMLKALQLRGIVLFDMQRHDEALETLQRARAQVETLGDERELARIENNIGRCALQAGNHTEAMQWVQRAASRFSELGMDAEWTRAFWCLARIDKALGKKQEAIAELERVEHEFKKLGMYNMAEKVGAERKELAEAA